MMEPMFDDLAADPAKVAAVLRHLGLIHDGAKLEIDALTGGVSSNILRVNLPTGPVCLKQALPRLKTAKEWLAPTSRVLAEMDWLQTAQRIVPGKVPRILGEDRAKGVFVMEFLGGLLNWKTELLAGRVDVAAGHQVASVLAAMHRATAADPSLADRFSHQSTFFAIRLEPYLLEAARAHPDLAIQLVRLVHDTQTHQFALVHGDVSPKNILLDGSKPVLLDAECACWADPAFDLAFLLNHVLLKSAHMPSLASRLLGLYEGMVQTYLPQVDWEPTEDFEGRCARLLPGLLLARIDGKSPVEYLDEPTRGLVRRAARSLLEAAPDRLNDVLGAWRDLMSRQG